MKRIFSGILVLATAFILVSGCSKQEKEPLLPKEKARDFANVLYNRQLFQPVSYTHLTLPTN